MSPIALYQEIRNKEIQARILHSEIAPTLTISYSTKRPQLKAQWVKEDGRLIYKWHICK